MKVLVAGATGAIGVPLVRALTAGDGPRRSAGRGRQAYRRRGDSPADRVEEATRAPPRHGPDQRPADLWHRQPAGAGIVSARRFVTQSMVFGYGYGDHGQEWITEDKHFGPPGHGRFEQHLAALRQPRSKP
jgi:hypothetical protein